MSTPVPIILCADDFSLSDGVNKGILELVDMGRLSAVSCMSSLPAFSTGAPEMKALRRHVDLGVHITLSDQEPLGTMPAFAPDGKFPSFKRVLKQAVLGRLPVEEIAAEVERQLNAFTDAFDEPPDFLDGHHHVHQLPKIRSIIVSALARWRTEKGIYIRACNDRFCAIARRQVSVGTALSIGIFGPAMRRAAAHAGIPTNTGFSGVYDFSGPTAYHDVFPKFLNALRPRSLIFCHPGMADEELRQRDSLVERREDELGYLRSDKFRMLLESRRVVLHRFEDTDPQTA